MVWPCCYSSLFFLVDEARRHDAGVLVHCFAGISRSATVAIAYIMNHKKCSLDEAYRLVVGFPCYLLR